MSHLDTAYPDLQSHCLESQFPSESAERAAWQYHRADKAEAYALRITGTGTDHREKRCILEALAIAGIPTGASVLDCPCGPGRLIPVLKKSGFTVTGADISASMIDLARSYAGPGGKNCLDEKDRFCVANLFATGFEDGRFDAVICHRVFQYFARSSERFTVLSELRRISSGPLIVSFSCNWSIDNLWYKIRRFLGLTRVRKCQPISPLTFARDIRSAGFGIKRWIAMRPLVSKRWYVVLEPAPKLRNSFLSSFSAYRRIIAAAGKRVAACVLAAILPFFAYGFIVNSDAVRYHQIKDVAMQYQDGDDVLYLTNSSGLETSDLADENIKLTDISHIDNDIINAEKHAKDSFFLFSNNEMQKLRSYRIVSKLEFVSRIKLGTNQFYLMRYPNKY